MIELTVQQMEDLDRFGLDGIYHARLESDPIAIWEYNGNRWYREIDGIRTGTSYEPLSVGRQVGQYSQVNNYDLVHKATK